MEKERKIQIIKAAIKRFTKHGLNKTTVDEIARDLRIGKATIYHYFDSKEDLFYATLNWEAVQFKNDLILIFKNPGKDLTEKLKDYFLFKEESPLKYKLLNDVFILLLKNEAFVQEEEFVKNFLSEEEELILQELKATKGKPENLKALAGFLVMESWGIIFINILSGNSKFDFNEKKKQIFYNNIEVLINNIQQK